MKTEMTLQARIRRLKDTLIIAGDAVIAFSVWAVAKMALFMAFTSEERVREILLLEDTVPMFVIFVASAIAVGIDLSVRAYVGLSARAEGRGKKKSPFYLVVAVIAGLMNAMSAITIVMGTSTSFSGLDAVVSFFIELTAFAAVVMVVYCSVRLRRLGKDAG